MPVERLPREKHAALGEMGVREVPFLQDYDRVPHVTVGEMYPEICAVKITPPKPLHGEVNLSCPPRE